MISNRARQALLVWRVVSTPIRVEFHPRQLFAPLFQQRSGRAIAVQGIKSRRLGHRSLFAIGRKQMFTLRKQIGESRPQSKHTVIASLAALGSVVLASSCCLPLLPFLFAAGAAGTSAFFVKIRPFLLAASLLFIAFGFYQGWRAKQCKCKPRFFSKFLFWFLTIVVVVFYLFSQWVSTLV